jgi:hypothetical protein
MRDPKRIKRILQLVEIIWEANPDFRLCQVIINSLGMNSDPFYIEDDDLEKALIEYIKVM